MNNVAFLFIATASLLGATLIGSRFAEDRAPEQLAEPLASIPKQILDWTGEDGEPLSDTVEQVLAASDYLTRGYTNPKGDWLRLFIAFYALQRAGESMHSPRNCLPGSGWEMWKYDAVDVPVEGRLETVNKYWIQKGGSRLLIYYWYQSAERVVASEYYAKVCLVWDAVTKRRTAGSIVRLEVPDTPEGEKYGLGVCPSIRKVASVTTIYCGHTIYGPQYLGRDVNTRTHS